MRALPGVNSQTKHMLCQLELLCKLLFSLACPTKRPGFPNKQCDTGATRRLPGATFCRGCVGF
jgi:hypothetical protein